VHGPRRKRKYENGTRRKMKEEEDAMKEYRGEFEERKGRHIVDRRFEGKGETRE